MNAMSAGTAPIAGLMCVGVCFAVRFGYRHDDNGAAGRLADRLRGGQQTCVAAPDMHDASAHHTACADACFAAKVSDSAERAVDAG